MIRFVRIFLLVLIIIGIGLLFTQSFWVPKVVEAILAPESQPTVIQRPGASLACDQQAIKQDILSTSTQDLSPTYLESLQGGCYDLNINISNKISDLFPANSPVDVECNVSNGEVYYAALFHGGVYGNTTLGEFFVMVNKITLSTLLNQNGNAQDATVGDILGYSAEEPEQFVTFFNIASGTLLYATGWSASTTFTGPDSWYTNAEGSALSAADTTTCNLGACKHLWKLSPAPLAIYIQTTNDSLYILNENPADYRDYSLERLNLSSGAIIWSIPNIYSFTFNTDRSAIYAGKSDGTLIKIDPETGTQLASTNAPLNPAPISALGGVSYAWCGGFLYTTVDNGPESDIYIFKVNPDLTSVTRWISKKTKAEI
ncbi:MAG: hypothetical protein ACYC75_01950 [Minisyncoccota bacterium]